VLLHLRRPRFGVAVAAFASGVILPQRTPRRNRTLRHIKAPPRRHRHETVTFP
jgi:hypothetical protein